jgi:hypothetical protein
LRVRDLSQHLELLGGLDELNPSSPMKLQRGNNRYSTVMVTLVEVVSFELVASIAVTVNV